MKRWFLLVLEIAVSNVSARKLMDFSSPHRPGLDLDGMEAMVLQLGSQSSPEKLKPLFDDFRKLLQKELLPRLHQEQGTANSLLEDAAKGFALCKGVDSSRISALVTEHKQCRADEFDDQIIQSRACNSSKHLAQVQQQNCKAFEDVDIYPEEVPKVCNKGTNDTSHEAHAKRVRDFYASKVQAFLNAQQLCENTTADASFLKRSCDGTTRNLEMKSQECLRIQRSLDDLACEAWTALYACEERNSCLSQARHRYLDANRTGVSTEADLMSQWRAVKRIECFLDAMEKNTTVQECRRQSIDGSPMALSYPFFQDKAPMMPNTSSCEKPKFPQPGSVDYSKKVYELGTPSALPATCTAECCSRCEFFTCNGSTVLKPGAKIRPGFSQEICCHLPPKAQWKADDWPKAVCSTECGLHEVYETRKVVCWDAANQAEMDEELCGGLAKPSLKRLRCAATSSCRTCQAKTCPAKYVAKVHPPSTCKGLKCTVEECCNRRCSAEDCPVGYGLKSPAPMCTSVHNCTVNGCCGPTRWIYEKWSDATCDKSCGLPEVIESRSVHCAVYPLKDSVAKEQCKGSMPATSRVQCPATTPCVTWVYPPWADETIDCAAAKRGCGLRELVEERPVECKDQRSQIILPDDKCTGIKPSSRRVICPSTPECKETETLTTTLASTAVTTAVTTAAPATSMQAAKVGSWVAPAWSKPDCSQRCCGLGELKEERAVLCMDCNGQLLPECSCAGPKPLTSTVLCPATSPCGSPLATTALATTSTMSTTAAPTTTAPVTTTTQAAPSPVWVYTAWMTDKSNCEARSCGQGALMQERPVVCQDLASGVKLMDSKCSGSKPPTTRVLCPATAACSVVSSTTTTTAACCPRGYSLKPPEELPLSCKQGSCEVQNCCSPVSWFHEEWDETQECNASCGLPEQLQERSVTCQATDGGEVSKDAECRGVRMPARQRTLCPATQPCTSCSGFICNDESFPILPPPACPNGKCDSQRCCAKFLSGFHTQPGLKAMAVTNEGRRGGTLQFQGEAPQLSDGGHFFRLNGETSMNLLTPSVHNGLTAFIYLRPHAQGWVDKEQVVLVNKGLAGATWKLVLTPMKQFRIWNFKAERPSSCTCTTVHEDLWSHIMVKDNATAMELAVNGKVCCATKSGIAPVNSGGYSIWLEEGLQADLHAVQVWDSALNEHHVAHVTRRYHKAIPDWLPLQHLSCLQDAVQFLTGISSLAHCKLRCEEHEMCRSVLFDIARSRCVLRSRFACASCGCTRNMQSLTANYDGGCRKNGAFDWRLSVTLEEKTVRVTELAFLDDEQHQINADVMSDDNFTKLPASCDLNDWKTVGPGCAIPHGSGFWEYRFKKCVNPTYLLMAVKEGDLPENFPVKIRYSTATGEWKECVARPVLWITSDHSESALRRFHLSCFGSAPLAESPWWHH